MSHTPLGPGVEFDRIRAIAQVLGPSAASLGDDCAVVPPFAGSLVVSTDLSVEGVHFRRHWLTMEESGWRAAAAALSDLAAQGADCLGVLAAVAAPRAAPESDVSALMRGVGLAATAAGGQVLGGDLSVGTDWTIAVTALGRAVAPVARTGAVPGDGVWVTGSLGAARAALEAWTAGGEPDSVARDAFAHPVPRLRAGRWLAAHGARAMLDLSDGLASDAGHLAAASAVGLELDLGTLPLAQSVGAAAVRAGEEAAVFAARGGEDYELLVVLPPEFSVAEATTFRGDCMLPLTRIGRVTDGGTVVMSLDGHPVRAAGFDHFA